MAQRRAGTTVKISVSLDKDDVAALRRRAREAHQGNLSAAFSEAIRGLRQRQALDEAIEMLGGSTLTPEAAAAIDAEFAGGPRYEPEKYKGKRS
jgi:hypothetical protein